MLKREIWKYIHLLKIILSLYKLHKNTSTEWFEKHRQRAIEMFPILKDTKSPLPSNLQVRLHPPLKLNPQLHHPLIHLWFVHNAQWKQIRTYLLHSRPGLRLLRQSPTINLDNPSQRLRFLRLRVVTSKRAPPLGQPTFHLHLPFQELHSLACLNQTRTQTWRRDHVTIGFELEVKPELTPQLELGVQLQTRT